MANDIRFRMGFDLDKQGLNQLKQEISNVKSSISQMGKEQGLTKEMREAVTATEALEKALGKAHSKSLDKLNTKKFTEELKKSGTSLVDIEAKLRSVGLTGGKSITDLNNKIKSTGVEIKQANKLLDEMFDTFGKTVKWGIASSMMNQMTGSIQRAVGFTKALDESLNQIRVVSGQNAAEMASFSKEANGAAKALGKTTTEYTDASLLFFQQGKSAEEVRKLTESTLLAANITGTDVSQMADMITSALNGYSMAADEAVRVTDVLAAIGAATGSDFNELATAMSKVASQAATVGVPFEQLNAMLATISETTREAPETIGTSLKTVFARISEIQTKGSIEDEDGVYYTFGKVEDALSMVNISLKETDGAMRDVGDVITDIGGRWGEFDTITKSAITNALAGQRQASRLMALFNQWERYEVALNEAMNSTGATLEQNEVRMDSIEYKTKQMRAELERLWMNIINSDVLKDGFTVLTKVLEQINKVAESLDGMGGIFTLLAGIATTVFGKQISSIFTNFNKNIKNTKETIREMMPGAQAGKTPEEVAEYRKDVAVRKTSTPEEQAKYKAQKEELNKLNLISQAEEKNLNTLKQQLAYEDKKLINLENQKRIKTSEFDKSYAEAEIKYGDRRNQSLQEAIAWNQTLKRTKDDYTETIMTLTDKEIKQLGISREILLSYDSFKGVIRDIKTSTISDGIIETGDDLEEINKLEAGLNRIDAKIKETKKASKELSGKTATKAEDIESVKTQATVVQQQVDETVTKAENKLKGVNITRFIGVAATAFATLKPAFETLGDVGASTSDKMDAFGNSLLSIGLSAAMIGGPIGLIAGAVLGLGAILLKVGKNFLTYDKAVKQNTETIERYKKRTSELTKEISQLENQSSRLKDLQREMALVGGDLTKMTVEQQEAYKALGNEIAETAPEMIAYYDSQGNAILKVGAQLDDLTEKKKQSLQEERQRMAESKDSFLVEYSHDIQKGKEKLALAENKANSLQEELDRMKESGKSSKKISKKAAELDTAKQDVEDLKARLDGLDSNIQQNIIDPFMLSNKEVSKVDDSVKQVVASVYSIEKVEPIMERYRYKWEVVNGEAKKVKRSYEEMADVVSQELTKLEKQSTLVAAALNRVSERASKEEGEETRFKDIEAGLKKADQAAQVFIGTMAAMGGTVEGSVKILEKMSNSIDKFGMVKNVNVNDIFAIQTEASQKQIAELEKEIASITKEFDASAEAAAKASANYNQSSSHYTKAQYAGDYYQTQRDLAEVEDKLSIKTKELGEAQVLLNQSTRDAIAQQERLNTEYEKYLMSVASTPEGMNQLIQSYNAEYEQHKLINEALNQKAELIKETVEDETGKEVTVETQTFEDSDLGNYFFDFQETLLGLIDEDFVSFEDTLSELMSYGADVGQEMVSKFQEMGETLQDLPKGVLESFKEMGPGMESAVNEVMEKGSKASADSIASVSGAIQKQQQDIGRMYAAINKDNVHYFAEVKKQNVEQMQLVATATGVMGDDYATYAEYKNALDQWMADNSEWLADQEAANMYWSAAQAINAKYEQQIANAMSNGNMEEADRLSAEARAQASEAAAWAGALAEAKAAKERATMLQNSLKTIDTSTTNKEIGEAAKAILERKAAETEADIALYDSLISQLEAKLQSVGGTSGGGGGGGGGGASRPSLNLSAGGGNVPLKPTTPKPSQGTPTPTGKPDGGGKDKDDKDKEVEDLEWEEDIYHDINVQLELKQQLLDKLKKQQDKLYGKELLDNLAQQKKALQDQQKLLEKKLEMQKKDLEQQKQALSKQGVKFNVDGTIANYNELLKQKVAYVNSLSGEAKEAAKEEFDSLVEMMEKYEELMINNINETENAIQDAIDAQREIFLQEFEYKITVQLELSEDFQKAVQFQKDMATDFEDYSENYQRTMDQLGQKLGEVGAIQEHINNIQNDTSLTEKERLEMLSEYTEKMKEAVKDAKKLQEEMKKLVEGALKDGLDLIKEHLDQYKNIDNQIKHIQGTLKLLGQEQNYEFLDELYEAQYQNIQSQLDVLLAQKNALIAQRDTYAVGSDEWKMFNEQLTKTEDQINKLSQDSIKVLQDSFKNSINAIMDDLDKALSKGIGLKELRDEYDKLKDSRKEYLDIEEKVTEVGKLQKKLQDAMKSTTDPKQLAALQKFKETELKNLREKDKLTQYDLDRANQLYELTLKQIALDEQRNAKAIMRLIRDAQGNWVYEFVEDAEAVAQAQDDLSKELEKLQELDKKQFEKTQEDMIKEKEKYVKQVQDIINKQMKGEFESDDAFKEALAQAQTDFNDRMLELGDRLNEAQVNGVTSSLATMLQAYYENDEALGMLSENEEEMMKQLADAIGGDFTQLNELMAALNSGNLEDFNAMAEGMGLNASELQTALEGVTGGIREDWGGNITDMIGDVANLGTDTATTVDQILAKWEEYKGKVEETTGKTGDSLDRLKDKLGAVEGATDILNQKTNDLIGKFEEEMTQIGKVVKEYDKLKGAYDDNIKKATDYIGKLDELIKKQKEQATGVTTPTAPTQPPSTSSSGSTGSGSGSTTTTPPPAANKNPSFSNNEAVRVKSKSKYFAVSSLTGNYGWANTGTKYLIDDPSRYKPMSGYSGNVHISSSSGGDLGWLPKNMLEKFDTGGYTGAWGNDGKVAMLHEKEIVLNKQDTKNILDAVKTVRGSEGAAGLGQLFKASVQQAADRIVGAINRLGTGMAPNKSELSSLGPADSSNEIKQTVQINADFSGVKNSGEIEKAFNSLAIQASQYASKRN